MVVSHAVMSRVIWPLARVLFSVTTDLKQNLNSNATVKIEIHICSAVFLFLYISYMKEVGKSS